MQSSVSENNEADQYTDENRLGHGPMMLGVSLLLVHFLLVGGAFVSATIFNWKA